MCKFVRVLRVYNRYLNLNLPCILRYIGVRLYNYVNLLASP